jgi:Glucose / Sorbosone dehydrogenase/IPT/TIG domain
LPYHRTPMRKLLLLGLFLIASRLEAAVPAINLEVLETGLPAITGVTNAGDGRLFLTTQEGQILIRENGQILPAPFLDVSSLISCCGERGLLSTAFHPDYAQTGFFFVDYTDRSGDTVVARYRVFASDPNRADPGSAAILLTIRQPFANHNGGQLQFGPDGYLYIGMGDGGSGNDPNCNAQSNGSLLGKLLRIDVDQSVSAPPFHGIPPDNPFVSSGGPREAWAKGLRNPWRFSFDRLTGDLFIGDVGQGALEEVDYAPIGSGGGRNYGWKVMEGTSCGGGGTSGCNPVPPPCGDPGYTLPVLEYDHDGGRCSITGGYRVRGLSVPDLYGMYVYGDYCSGQIFAAQQVSGAWTPVELPVVAPNLTTFGEDSGGDLYLATQDGVLSRFAPSAPPVPSIATLSPASGLTRGGTRVTITGSNFTGATAVSFGSVPATVQVANPSTLTAQAPPQPPGVVNVTVSNPGAPPAVKVAAFAYLPYSRVEPHRATRVLVRP